MIDEDESLYLQRRTCAVCGNPILDASTIPTCYSCGWAIAQKFADRILAEDRASTLAALESRRKPPSRTDGNGLVYYVRIGRRIKIGFTGRFEQRMKALRVEQEDILAVEPGPPELERQRHREFAGDRLDTRKENFRESERLVSHMQALREQHPIPRLERARPNTTRITHRRVADGSA